MGLQEDLKYPFNEEGWYWNIGLGMLFEYLTFLLLPVFFLAGYYVRVMRQTAAGEEEPPEFGNYGSLTIDGIKVFCILFAYLLIPIIVAWSTYIPSLIALLQGEPGALSGILVGMLLSFSLTLLFAYGGIAGLVNFAHTGAMRSAFSPSLLGVITTWAWFKAWIKLFVTSGISLVASVIIGLIPLVQFTHIVLIPFQVKYFFTVYARIFSLAFATAAGTAVATEETTAPKTGRNHPTGSTDRASDNSVTGSSGNETEEATETIETSPAEKGEQDRTPTSDSTHDDRTTTRTKALEQPAECIQVTASAERVTDGVDRLAATVEAVVEETDAVEAGIVDPTATPVEQAAALEDAIDRGRLFDDESVSDDRTTLADGVDERSELLSDAVLTVRSQTTPQTDEGDAVLDSLASADELDEQQLTATLRNALETLDERAELETALVDIERRPDRQHLSRILHQQGGALEGDAGSGFETVADELDRIVTELTDCRAERERYVDNTETIRTAIAGQTTLDIDSATATDQWITELSDSVQNGGLSLTDREQSMEHLVSNIESRVRPESTLSEEFLETLHDDLKSAETRQRTIADALEAIESSETLSHRLDGISPKEVERLAARLQETLSGMETAGSDKLTDRVMDLRQIVATAGDSDRMTVYAARQELRFYDRQLLDALQQSGDRSHSEAAVTELYENVEQRRSRMRTQYPSDYPNHDHSIPIHFLELVTALEESAEEAKHADETEQAVGYLQAADRTLDWVAELYEKQAYSTLLKQLRG